MRPLSRRTLLKATTGFIAFVPLVGVLTNAPPATADCGCNEPPPPVYGPPPPGYRLCDEIRVWVADELCLQNWDGSWTIYYDQKVLDAFYDVDCTDWYLFNTGIPCPAAY